MLLRFRSGLPLLAAPMPCWSCETGTMDVLGDHAVICKSGLGRCFRHSRVSRVLSRLALKAGLNVVCEPRQPGQAARGAALVAGPDEIERRRPADLEIFHWNGNRSLAADVVMTSPTAETWRRGAANGAPGWAAAGAAWRKQLHYGPMCVALGKDFLPFAIETCGGLGPEVMQILERIGPHWAARSGLEEGLGVRVVCDQLSVAHQRALGAVLAARVPLRAGEELLVGRVQPRGRRGRVAAFERGPFDAWGVVGARGPPAGFLAWSRQQRVNWVSPRFQLSHLSNIYLMR